MIQSPRSRRMVRRLLDRLGFSNPFSNKPEFSPAPGLQGEPIPASLDAIWSGRSVTPSSDGNRPTLLITAPFLARGGAEQTLYATLEVLSPSCRSVIATLAHHLPELGDRRPDFARICPDIYSLGDWLHPDAMLPVLIALIDHFGIGTLYNANSTTLFYDFAPVIRRERPHVRIVDHLYDHRVGYIEYYSRPELTEFVDACVAENQPIADVLVNERGWPKERVPVIWPCGRPLEDLPAPEDRNAVRTRIRRDLGLEDDAVVVLTAARMHEQKRPLDLVGLAERVRDLDRVHLLVAGGGPLEDAFDAAVSASPGARIRRLGFRDDVPELIVASDLGCLVSDFEGLPVFLLECLQLGRPFLGTDVGDMGRLLRDTGAGVVVDRPGDLDGLEAALRALADGAFRLQRAAAARRAGPRFDPVHCAAEYARVLGLTLPGFGP